MSKNTIAKQLHFHQEMLCDKKHVLSPHQVTARGTAVDVLNFGRSMSAVAELSSLWQRSFFFFKICLGFWNFCLFCNIWELFQTGAFPGIFSIHNFNLHHFKVDEKAPIVGTFIAWDFRSGSGEGGGGGVVALAVKSPTVCDPLHSTARVELIQRAALSDLWHNSNLCPPPRDSPCAVASSSPFSFSSFLWEGLVFRCRDDNWDGEEEGRDGRTLGGYITTEKVSDLWRLLTSPSSPLSMGAEGDISPKFAEKQ